MSPHASMRAVGAAAVAAGEVAVVAALAALEQAVAAARALDEADRRAAVAVRRVAVVAGLSGADAAVAAHGDRRRGARAGEGALLPRARIDRRRRGAAAAGEVGDDVAHAAAEPVLRGRGRGELEVRRQRLSAIGGRTHERVGRREEVAARGRAAAGDLDVASTDVSRPPHQIALADVARALDVAAQLEGVPGLLVVVDGVVLDDDLRAGAAVAVGVARRLPHEAAGRGPAREPLEIEHVVAHGHASALCPQEACREIRRRGGPVERGEVAFDQEVGDVLRIAGPGAGCFHHRAVVVLAGADRGARAPAAVPFEVVVADHVPAGLLRRGAVAARRLAVGGLRPRADLHRVAIAALPAEYRVAGRYEVAVLDRTLPPVHGTQVELAGSVAVLVRAEHQRALGAQEHGGRLDGGGITVHLHHREQVGEDRAAAGRIRDARDHRAGGGDLVDADVSLFDAERREHRAARELRLQAVHGPVRAQRHDARGAGEQRAWTGRGAEGAHDARGGRRAVARQAVGAAAAEGVAAPEVAGTLRGVGAAGVQRRREAGLGGAVAARIHLAAAVRVAVERTAAEVTGRGRPEAVGALRAEVIPWRRDLHGLAGGTRGAVAAPHGQVDRLGARRVVDAAADGPARRVLGAAELRRPVARARLAAAPGVVELVERTRGVRARRGRRVEVHDARRDAGGALHGRRREARGRRGFGLGRARTRALRSRIRQPDSRVRTASGVRSRD